jgi:ParB family chromosome partitioning protein
MPGSTALALTDIEKKLTSHLGARSTLKHSPKRGRIIIEYAGNDDLQRVLGKMGLTL